MVSIDLFLFLPTLVLVRADAENMTIGTLDVKLTDEEIKDATGRYRHTWRAPVNEATLQPMRRVSKAGLESSAYI